ncbi:triacylglycerol lipase [Mucor ambiguus]|uniref:Triacylglycerol lipase n=1 Tax=Mucor ambiguus TaxID=91626 RepID=A0A0C9LUI5_9FUNG|nr:triacylglycerol lipase [Mucor ambiguus]
MTLLSLSNITQQLKSVILSKAHVTSSSIAASSNHKKSVEDIDLNQPVVLYPRRIDKVRIAADIIRNISTTKANASTKAEMEPATSGLSMPVTPHYVAPRAPIVLCHGLYGFDKLGPDALPLLQVQYWGGIENELAKLGAKVIVTKVPSTGSIWDRAHTLHSILKSILDGRDVNFVAHSMGGLDCRYLISHIPDRPYKINSLTTISTPHRGSPVMDWFRDNVGVGMAGALVAAIEKINQQKVPPELLSPELKETLMEKQRKSNNTCSPSLSSSLSWSLLAEFAKSPKVMKQLIRLVDTEAYANLSTDYCKNYFNPNTPNDPSISYYSYGANASFPAWSLLNLPSKWIKDKEGINDGLVSVESAKWGTYIKTLQADHWDLNGQRYRWKHTRPFIDKTKFDTIDFYMEMATHLYQQGH